MSDNWFYEYFINEAKSIIRPCSGGGSVPKPLTYDYMPEGYPSKSVQTVTLMEEQEVAFSVMDGIYAAVSPVEFELREGETYTVVWDGVEYKCVCHTAATGPIDGDPYIGNPVAFGLEPTGEPFFYAITENAHMWASYDTATAHTIGVTTSPEIITPMSYDYMPEGYPKKSGWSIEWDGNPEGKIAVAAGGMQLYKISDMVLSVEDLLSVTITFPDHPGETSTITSDRIHAISDDIVNVGGAIRIVIVRKDNAAANGITFPEKGVYAFSNNDKFKMSKETITPISLDFIPNGLFAVVFKQVHDQYFAGTDLHSTGYSDAEIITEFANKNNSYSIFQPGKFGGKVLSAYNDVISKYLTVVLAASDKVECRKASYGSTDIEQLWSIQKDGVIISSSTEGSTKKFKITVDDTGTLSATEVHKPIK